MMKIMIDENGIFVHHDYINGVKNHGWVGSSLLTALEALTHSNRMLITNLKLPDRGKTIQVRINVFMMLGMLDAISLTCPQDSLKHFRLLERYS